MAIRNYANRQYYCPLCGRKEMHGTNHTGEIYTRCKGCGHSVLYCAEENNFTKRPYIIAKIHCYYFNDVAPDFSFDDFSEESQTGKYKKLVEEISAKGYKVFDTIALAPFMSQISEQKAMSAHDGKLIKLYNPEQFNNQYVSNIGRVFQWKEWIYPNKRVKAGYWLEIINPEPQVD